MIFLLLALAISQASPAQNGSVQKPPAQIGPTETAKSRLDRCVSITQTDPAAGLAVATRWRIAGGGAYARQCGALAHVRQGDWAAAAAEFTEAARAAELAHDEGAASYWAEAGNAWLAAGDATKARTALDAALAAGTLTGLQLGEAQLDHARALVAADQMDAARIDLDHAVVNAGDDPLAWLLSATLARRLGDVPRARKDIAQALLRSADDASVQLEAGNIAALARDEAGARTAWAEAARLAPDTDTGRNAVAALRQFDAPAK